MVYAKRRICGQIGTVDKPCQTAWASSGHDELPWPIRGWEAVDAGLLTVRELRRFYVPVYPDVHVLRGVELSAAQRARAAWLWSRRRGVIAGLSAAAMLGCKWIEPGLPAELVHTNRRQPPMLMVHSDDVDAGEVQLVNGMAVTTAARTAFDIGRRVALEPGVRPTGRGFDERHRRQSLRYRIRRRSASWCAWPGPAPSHAKARRRWS